MENTFSFSRSQRIIIHNLVFLIKQKAKLNDDDGHNNDGHNNNNNNNNRLAPTIIMTPYPFIREVKEQYEQFIFF